MRDGMGAVRRSSRLARTAMAALALALAFAAPLAAQQRQLTLKDAVALAQQRSHQAVTALSTRDAARLRFHSYTSSLLPQLTLNGNVPIYNKTIIPVVQPDGSTLFRAQQQSTSSLTVNLSQRLPFTGGELFMSSALSRLQINGERDTRNWSSTPFTVGIRQNILRTNTAAWDGRQQEISADAADRQFTEAREDIAIATAGAFFDYYAAKVALANAATNVEVNDSLYTLNKGRFEVGKISENDLLQSELALLRMRTSLDGARLEHDRTLAALRLQLNLPEGTPVEIVIPEGIPTFTADTAVAVAQALRNRAQMKDLDLQTVQAARRVSEAKYNSGFGLNVQASMGYNQTGGEVNAVYKDLRDAQNFSVGVSMPLMQWGSRSATIQAARADQRRTESTVAQTRERVAFDAHFAALQLAQSARQLALSAKGDTVGAKRFEVAKNRYIVSRITIDILYQAQTEKDAALLAYVQALRGYWTAYYQLRKVTLFDFEAGQPIR
jgi:outer membrane protein TolC